jgi:UDP-N-acetylmuramoyl-L-alanyl-D-glutamate--2,6-diaminopimelate ligase
MFAAMPGSKVHGAAFIAMALEKGASAILTDADAQLASEALAGSDLALIIAEDPCSLGANRISVVWPHPDVMVAVTGTNSKTSVSPLPARSGEALAIPSINIGTTGVEGRWSAHHPHHPDP